MSDLPPWSLDSEIRDALQSLVCSMCVTSLQTSGETSYAERLHDASQAVYGGIQDSIQHFSRVLNDALPINQLPSELFLAVVSFLPFYSRIAVTHVCQHWRTICIHTPDLWSTYKSYMSNDGQLEKAAIILARSGAAPLMLDLESNSAAEALGALVSGHIHHMQRLRLHVDLEWNSADAVAHIIPLMYALREPAPMLRDLDLSILRLTRDTIEADIRLPTDFLAHSAPLLESAQLHGVACDGHPYPALSQVRVLSLASPDVDMSGLLDIYPLLEQLRVHAERFVSTRRVTTHRLEHLDIDATIEAAELVCSQLLGPRPLSICMDLVPEDVFSFVISHASRRALKQIQLYANFPSSQRCVKLHYETGDTWILGPTVSVPVLPQTLLDQDLMYGLRDLTIHEVLWPMERRVVVGAMSLIRLELVLGRSASPIEYNSRPAMEETCGIFYDPAWSEIMCPALKEVCISARDDLALVADVHDVGDFVNYRVRFVCLQLCTLVLRNVQLYDPTRGRGMETLTNLVTNIEYRSTPPRPIPQVHGQSHPMNWVFSLQQ